MSTVLALFHPLLSEAPSPRPLLIYLSTPRWPHLVAQPCRSSTSLHGRIGCLLIRGTPTSLWTPEQRLEEGAKWKRKCWETRIWTRCHARYQTRIFQWLPTETLLSTLDSFFLYSFWSIRQAERAHRSMFKRPFSIQKKTSIELKYIFTQDWLILSDLCFGSADFPLNSTNTNVELRRPTFL